MVKYRFARYRQYYEEHYNTLEEAMRSAFFDFEEGRAYCLEIIDGTRVYKITDMLEYWKSKGWLESEAGDCVGEWL